MQPLAAAVPKNTIYFDAFKAIVSQLLMYTSSMAVVKDVQCKAAMLRGKCQTTLRHAIAHAPWSGQRHGTFPPIHCAHTLPVK